MKALENKTGQSTAVSELEAITKKRTEVINGVKIALASALTAAAENYRLLQKEGLNEVLAEQQFKDACEALGITIPGVPAANGKTHGGTRKTRTSNRKGVSFVEAIKRSLADGKTRNVDEIYKKVQAIKGQDVSRNTMLACLSVARKEGAIRPTARGQYVKS